jgi:hypothetical protein
MLIVQQASRKVDLGWRDQTDHDLLKKHKPSKAVALV